ncbi:MAG: hypothetical protein R3D55_14805, partial [Chloroflexota bacterium]
MTGDVGAERPFCDNLVDNPTPVLIAYQPVPENASLWDLHLNFTLVIKRILEAHSVTCSLIDSTM